MDNVREIIEAVNKVFSIRLSVGTIVYCGLGYWIWQNQGSVMLAGVIGFVKGVWQWLVG